MGSPTKKERKGKCRRECGKYYMEVTNPILCENVFPYDGQLVKILELPDINQKEKKLNKLLEENEEIRNTVRLSRERILEHGLESDESFGEQHNDDEVDYEIPAIITKKDIEILSHLCICAQEKALFTFRERSQIPLFPPRNKKAFDIIKRLYPDQIEKSGDIQGFLNTIRGNQNAYNEYRVEMGEKLKLLHYLYADKSLIHETIEIIEATKVITFLNKSAAIASHGSEASQLLSDIWLKTQLAFSEEAIKDDLEKLATLFHDRIEENELRWKLDKTQIYLKLAEMIKSIDQFHLKHLAVDYVFLKLRYKLPVPKVKSYDDSREYGERSDAEDPIISGIDEEKAEKRKAEQLKKMEEYITIFKKCLNKDMHFTVAKYAVMINYSWYSAFGKLRWNYKEMASWINRFVQPVKVRAIKDMMETTIPNKLRRCEDIDKNQRDDLLEKAFGIKPKHRKFKAKLSK